MCARFDKTRYVISKCRYVKKEPRRREIFTHRTQGKSLKTETQSKQNNKRGEKERATSRGRRRRSHPSSGGEDTGGRKRPQKKRTSDNKTKDKVTGLGGGEGEDKNCQRRKLRRAKTGLEGDRHDEPHR